MSHDRVTPVRKISRDSRYPLFRSTKYLLLAYARMHARMHVARLRK